MEIAGEKGGNWHFQVLEERTSDKEQRLAAGSGEKSLPRDKEVRIGVDVGKLKRM